MNMARIRELDPHDDPEGEAMAALEDDADFCADFLAANWGAVINLLTGPIYHPQLRLAELRALQDKLRAAEHDELELRRDANV